MRVRMQRNEKWRSRWYKEDATTSFVAGKLGLKSCGDRQKEREALSSRRIKQSMRLQNI